MIKKIKEKILSIYKIIKNFIKNTAEDFYIIDIEEGKVRWSFNWWVLKTIKWLVAVTLAVIALLLWGCAPQKESVKYYPVSVPVNCPVKSPKKPKYSENVVTTNIEIIGYAQKLESALKACKGEN